MRQPVVVALPFGDGLAPDRAHRTRGVMSGEARTFLEDGTFITSPHMGTFKRNNSKIKVFFTDAVNNGVVNFIIWDIDILSKAVDVKYWEIVKAG